MDFTFAFETTGFPVGDYRLHIEYSSPDSEVIESTSVNFALKLMDDKPTEMAETPIAPAKSLQVKQQAPIDGLFATNLSFAGRFFQRTAPVSIHSCGLQIERKFEDGKYAGRLEFYTQTVADGQVAQTGYILNVLVHSKSSDENFSIVATGVRANPRGLSLYGFNCDAKIEGTGFKSEIIEMVAR